PIGIVYCVRRWGDTMWFAGTGGVTVVVGDQWFGDEGFYFRTSSGLPPTGTTSVALDDRGYVYASTADSGLYRSTAPFDPKSPQAPLTFSPVWTKATGAPTNATRSLLWDRGRLW